MNKKGEKLLTIWRIFMILVIGSSVALSVWVVYYANVDVDSENAKILADRLIDCFESYEGDINVYVYCGLDEKAFEKGDLFFKVIVGSQVYKEGNYAFENDCLISLKNQAENYPKCVLVKKEDIEVLVGVKQKGIIGGLG